MPTSKTLFDAVEAELRNARVTISNADRYLDAIKEAVETLEAKARIIEDIKIIPIVKALPKGEDVLKALRPGGFRDINEEEETRELAGMKAPLSLSAAKDVTDFVVKTENEEYKKPIAVDSEYESLFNMLKLRDVCKKLKEHMKLL